MEYLEFDQNQPVINNLLESITFRRRVDTCVQRVIRIGAEAGFAVFVSPDADKMALGTVRFGTRFAEGSGDRLIGLNENHAGVAIETDPIVYKELDRKGDKYITAACFHTHPVNAGFSNLDIEEFEKTRNRRDVKRNNVQYAEILGVVSKPRSETQRSLNLLTVWGNPKNSIYQAADYHRLNISQQVELFRNSGFNVLNVVLPVSGKNVDWSAISNLHVTK